MPRVPPPSSGASPAPTAHSTPTRVFLVACQQHGQDHPRCACAAVACDTSRGNVKKGHIQMSSPHNSKCEGSGGLHRPVGGGSCEGVSRRMHGHVAEPAFWASSAKGENGVLSRREETALQAAELGRDGERRTREKGTYSAPAACQACHPYSSVSPSYTPGKVDLLPQFYR